MALTRRAGWKPGKTSDVSPRAVPGPNPAPGAKFPKTDTLPGRARGGAHGLPRRVPWRPRPRRPPFSARKTGARKGAPKRPPTAPAEFSLPTAPCPAGAWTQGHRHRHTPHRTPGREAEAPTPRPAFIESPSGQLCKFPLDLSLSKGHSRSGTESLTATAPAGPPFRLRCRKPCSGPASPAAPGEGGKPPKAKQTDNN